MNAYPETTVREDDTERKERWDFWLQILQGDEAMRRFNFTPEEVRDTLEIYHNRRVT